jgi:hypothetical protein
MDEIDRYFTGFYVVYVVAQKPKGETVFMRLYIRNFRSRVSADALLSRSVFLSRSLGTRLMNLRAASERTSPTV